MITLSTLLNIAGFYLFYITSKRMRLSVVFGFEKWWNIRPRLSKSIGGLLLLLSLLICGIYFGIGAGTFLFLMITMSVASLLILIVPMGLLNKINLSFSILLFLLLEYFFHAS